ncbi:hypothetical protein UFOVP84_102 [uncultured Caudovirales phage]|uniref:Uncharacterized protein n=1 Tax=uncultured Caudovirales phage TaxID=2100421 RepID=A0A6J5KXL6_9CAUD|nr:hypothetical protein UFOVP84_102 [uncultured Caudovirales phage]
MLNIEYKRMDSFKDFLSEETKLGRLSIFDIDDTLFHTTAQIDIVKDGKAIKKLTNQQFNTYSLKQGESFDFGEFRSAEKFNKESKPISRMFDRAKAILSHSARNPLSKVIVVTARANFDDKEKFLDTFRKHRFDIDKVRVERAGNINDIAAPADKKFIIINNYLKTGQFDRVSLFDDAISNLTKFLELKKIFPKIKFEAYFVSHDGSIKLLK